MSDPSALRIVIAPDSFKESVTAPEAAAAMARGVRAVVPDADCVLLPMSDGGEGFTDALASALDARRLSVTTEDALGRPVEAVIARDGDRAILEVASAVGLDQIARDDRDPMRATSLGVGRMIRAALDDGARHLVIGLGGSVTTDGGAGMLHALGARFRDADGETLDPVPRHLGAVTQIDLEGLDPRLREVTVDVASDVTNPLTGPDGAAAVFGPQKGAGPGQVEELDAALARIAAVAGYTETIAQQPGAGAAGGLGYALLGFLGASLRPGVDLVADTVGLHAAVAGADLVLTGEGAVDAQTLAGKTPAGVAAIAREAGAPCVVIAGRISRDAEVLLSHGVDALVPMVHEAGDLDALLAAGAENLERTAATVMRLRGLGAR
ncbi:MAG: glycerate kinase [Brachybacterium sp.]|nr:glycerate kinase [Brachybacterium sp.]